jgi:hypothetical protein
MNARMLGLLMAVHPAAQAPPQRGVKADIGLSQTLLQGYWLDRAQLPIVLSIALQPLQIGYILFSPGCQRVGAHYEVFNPVGVELG